MMLIALILAIPYQFWLIPIGVFIIAQIFGTGYVFFALTIGAIIWFTPVLSSTPVYVANLMDTFDGLTEFVNEGIIELMHSRSAMK